MAGKRCSICGITWPIEEKDCPQCGGKVDGFRDAEPVSTDEARAARRHREFDEYLEEEGQT